MKLTAEREKLLAHLQAVIGVVERRQTMPVLANVLLSVRNGQLSITATDLEVELVAATEVTVQTPGDITVPGRKFLDILRAKGLPERRIMVHATRNALLPLVTDVAVMMGFLFQGQVLLEIIFAWPGVGRELVNLIFAPGSGLRDEASDWIVAADAQPFHGLTMYARSRLDADSLQIRQIEAGANASTKWASGFVRYLKNDAEVTGAANGSLAGGKQENLDIGGDLNIRKNWGVSLYGSRDMVADAWAIRDLGVWHRPRWEEAWFPDAFAGTMGSLLHAVETGEQPDIPGSDNLKTIALCEAVLAGAREHRVTRLDEFTG